MLKVWWHQALGVTQDDISYGVSRGIQCSFFHRKIKSSHQDQGLCYLQLPILFLYIQSPLLLENKKLLSWLFSSVN